MVIEARNSLPTYYTFELMPSSPLRAGYFELWANDSSAALRVSIIPNPSRAVILCRREGRWIKTNESKLPDLRADREIVFRVEHSNGGLQVKLDNKLIGAHQFPMAFRNTCRIFTSGSLALAEPPAWMKGLWRFSALHSGYPAVRELKPEPATSLKQGLSFILRAKNEEHIIEKSIRSIAEIADEIIFVDNDSEDKTLEIAQRLSLEFSALKIFQYNQKLPKVGRDHCQEVRCGGSNTLAHYYNYCLARSGRFNFMKWDADCIAIQRNLHDLIVSLELKNRADNVCVWLSGMQIYTDGSRYWLDTDSEHSEFQIFSKIRGAHWVNIPPWEEIDQTYLYTAHRLFYPKPVYVEIVRLDKVEFQYRGLYLHDSGDKFRGAVIKEFQESGIVPDQFREITGPQDPCLDKLDLCPREIEHMAAFEKHWRRVPMLFRSNGKPVVDSGRRPFGSNPAVLLVIGSAIDHKQWRNAVLDTWLTVEDRKRCSYIFAIERPGKSSRLDGQLLLLDSSAGGYLFVGFWLSLANYILDKTNYDSVFFVPENSMVNLDRVIALSCDGVDYSGGRVSISTNGMRFHDPKFGCLLTRKALSIVLENLGTAVVSADAPTAIAEALSHSGIHVDARNDWVQATEFHEFEQPELVRIVISDIPDPAALCQLYGSLSSRPAWLSARHAFAKHFRTQTDWMDIAKIEQLLTDG